DRSYIANNFVLTVAGAINEKEATKLVDKYLGQFPKGREVSFEPAHLKMDQEVSIVNEDLRQSKLAISFRGFPIYSRESDQAALMNIIFGQGLSSRLVNRIRHELSLAYTISSRPEYLSDS